VTHEPTDGDLAALPPTARRILHAAQTIVSERGYADLTMAAIEMESGANRALVSYYFGGKAGLVAALIESLFQDPDVGLVEEIRAESEGTERTERFLEWQRRVSANDRVNRMLYELIPRALRDPEIRARFAEEYRVYREVDGDCLGAAPAELSAEELEALAAVSVAVVEGLGIQRALDPDGFDHERAWRAWRDVIGRYLLLPGR
jgi:AcrR family transcriptional regulator